jgi:hypothetical protein
MPMTSVHSIMGSFTNAVSRTDLAVAVSVTRARGRFARFPCLSRWMPNQDYQEHCTRPQAIAQVLPACDGKIEFSSCLLFLVLRTPRSRGRGLM